MKVYHGSDIIINSPRILDSIRALDFGSGFYVTTNLEQARAWARTVAYRNATICQYVTSYEFNIDKAKKELVVIEFEKANGEWLDFICKNRQGKYSGEYDIVIGPVADDKVYRVVVNYENGELDRDEAIKKLKSEQLCDQILFHTAKSLEYLNFIDAEENCNER